MITAYESEAIFADVPVPTDAKVTGWALHPHDGPIRFLTLWMGHGDQSSVSVEGDQYPDGRVDSYASVNIGPVDPDDEGGEVRLSIAATLELVSLLTAATSKLVTR
jgi:hypothetical protein